MVRENHQNPKQLLGQHNVTSILATSLTLLIGSFPISSGSSPILPLLPLCASHSDTQKHKLPRTQALTKPKVALALFSLSDRVSQPPSLCPLTLTALYF